MKNEPVPPPRPETSAPPTEDQLLGFLGRYRNVLIISVVIFAAIVAVCVFYVNYDKDQERSAWISLHEASSTADPATTTENLQNALADIQGSSAEPWALYRLAVAEFKAGNIDASQEAFAQLERGYPDHYLFENPELAPAFGHKLSSEIAWREAHPYPEPEKTEGVEVFEDDGPGGAPGMPETGEGAQTQAPGETMTTEPEESPGTPTEAGSGADDAGGAQPEAPTSPEPDGGGE